VEDAYEALCSDPQGMFGDPEKSMADPYSSFVDDYYGGLRIDYHSNIIFMQYCTSLFPTKYQSGWIPVQDGDRPTDCEI